MRSFEGAFFGLTSSVAGNIPFLGANAREWATANMNRIQASTSIERNLPAGRTFDRRSLTTEQIKAFVAIPRAAPDTWQTALVRLVERYVRASPAATGIVTWPQIRDAEGAEARNREEADKRLTDAVMAEMGPDKVSAVTLVADATPPVASAELGSGKYAVRLSRNQINAASGAVTGAEGRKLKAFIRGFGAQKPFALTIVAEDAPQTPRFRKRSGNVSADIPVNSADTFDQRVADIALALKNDTSRITEMGFDIGLTDTVRPPRVLIQKKLNGGSLALAWNSVAQATQPGALQSVPAAFETEAIDTKWHRTGGSWTIV